MSTAIRTKISVYVYIYIYILCTYTNHTSSIDHDPQEFLQLIFVSHIFPAPHGFFPASQRTPQLQRQQGVTRQLELHCLRQQRDGPGPGLHQPRAVGQGSWIW